MARDHTTKRSSAREYKDKKQIMYEENVKFCRAVQSQPCLYDRTQSQLPKDINGAWRAVAAICGDTALSCKLRWQNIRFAFMRSLQTSSNRLPNRLRKYYLHDVLEFIIPHIQTSYNSTTEDESKEVVENNTEASKQPEDMTSAKLDIDFDEERTTSANETEEEDQTPWTPTNTSSKKKENSLILKENKVRKKEKKVTKDEVGLDNSDDDDGATWEEGSANEKEQVKSLRVKIEKIEAAKHSTTVEAEDVEANLRQFRFQRACKRSMDKSIVQQLSSPSPKNENESKRPRRSLSTRRATQKSNQEAKESMDFTPPPTKLEKSAKEDEKKHKGRGRPRLRLAEETRPESEPMTAMSSFIPSDIVETELKTSSSEEPAVVIEWAPPPPVIESVTIPITTQEALPKSSCVSFKLPASLLKIDRGTQCDSDFERSACDDEFLQLLRPQMAAMNARQRLHFKQKIYKSLIEVFDDPSNFPNSTDVPDASAFPVPPFPGVGPTTGAEMILIRELVSLVQAAKLTPELMKNNGASQGSEGAKTQSSGDVLNSTAATTLSPSQVPQPNNSVSQSKNSPPPLIKSNSNKIVFQSREQGMLDGGSQHSMLRKVVKVSSLVNNFREGGEKRRIYRILPKGVQPVRTPHSSTSSVGTFIIPRAPGSIASSVNAAAAAAAANGTNTFMTSPNKFREIPVGGGKMLVSQAGSNGLNETALCTRRMMAVRNVRSSGTSSAPRQIMRRYSICGSSGEGNKLLPMDNRRPSKILTTTAITSPVESQSLLLNSNNRPNNVRFVRATGTVTPPFKQPQLPMTVIPITQPHKTRATPGSHRKILSDKQIDVQSSLHQSDVEMQTLPLTGFNSVFSSSSSMTSSTAITSTTMRGTKTATKTATKTISPPKSSVETNEKEVSLESTSTVGNEIMDHSAILPHDSKEDTAAIISSDFFDSFSIKSEPLDEMGSIE